MATASELLLEQEEPHFIISEDLRTVTIPYGQNVIGVFSDENVRRIWFDMPDTCDGTDLSDFQISINYINALKESGRYYVTDATVADGTITFSWLVSRAVCASEGKVQFVVCLRLFDTDNETILKEFNTTITTMNVLVGIEAELELTDPQKDAVNSVVGPAIVATNDANAAALHAESAADGADDATAVARATANAVQAEAAEAVADVAEAVAGIDAKLAEVDEALDAMGDISELAVPLMSANVRGGAMLGSGLTVDDSKLSLGDVVTDSCDGPIYSVDAEGWAEQDTTTGKNLLEFSNSSNPNRSSYTYTKESADSIIATKNGNNGAFFACFIAHIPSAGSYTLSVGDSSNRNVYVYSDELWGHVVISNKNLNSSAPLTLTFDDAGDYVLGFFNAADAGTVVSLTVPQLEAGTTTTPYEPYTGGAPSPSPDYPQEIKVCRGRNLLDESAIRIGVNHQGGANQYRASFVYDVTAGFEYAFSIDGFAYERAIFFKDSNDNTVDTFPVTTASKSFVVPATTTYAVVLLNKQKLADGTTVASPTAFAASDMIGVSIQLELGSTPTPYVPYGCVGLEVQGRNLLPNEATTRTNSGVTFTVNADGSITARGTATAQVVLNVATSLPLDTSKFYTLSGCSGGSNSTYGLARDLLGVCYDEPVTAKPSQLDSAVYIFIRSGVTINTTFYPQLVEGTTAYDYQPYLHETRPIPLPLKSDGERWAGGLPDGTADALAIDSAGRWEWVNNADETTYDGSSDENFILSNGGKRVVIDCPNIKRSATTDTIANGFCSRFIANTPRNTYNNGLLGFSIDDKTDRLAFADGTQTMTVANWKTWLQANPVTVLYPIATPTTEHGYINLPYVPEGATIDIPELREVGVRCFVPGARELAEHAANWGKRNAEMESRLSTLEAAVAELATA